MEHKQFTYVIVNIIIFGSIYIVNSKQYTGHFVWSQLSFEDAVSQYRLIGEDIDDTLKDMQVILPSYTSAYGWIDAKATYHAWMAYLGCYVINPSLIQLDESVTSRRQLLDCVAKCTGYFYIGLKHSRCVCLSNLTLVSPDVTSTCSSYFCTGDDNLLCATDSGTNQYSLYTRGTQTVNANIGDCLAVTVRSTSGTPVVYEPVPCSNSLYPLCRTATGAQTAIYSSTSWNGAVLACATYGYKMATEYNGLTPYTSDGSYWLAQIRRPEFNLTKDFISGVEDYCVAANVLYSGYLNTIISSCNSLLYSLCSNDTTIDSVTIDSVTTDSTNTTDIPTSNDGSSSPMTAGLFALAVFLPGLFIVCIVALIGWFIWRCYPIKDANSRHGLVNDVDVMYNRSEGEGEGESEGEGDEISDYYDAAPKDRPYKQVSYYATIDGPSNYDSPAVINEEQDVSVVNGYQDVGNNYNHINHSRSNDFKELGYDTAALGDSEMMLNDYDVAQRVIFRNNTTNYDTNASAGMYDRTDHSGVNKQLEHYDTVSKILKNDGEHLEDQYHDVNFT